MSLDVFNEVELDQAVSKHDLVISLIPYTHHPTVIKSGLKYKKNIVTTSYVSDATRAFDDEWVRRCGLQEGGREEWVSIERKRLVGCKQNVE